MLHGDKADHFRNQRWWLRERGIGACLARSGIESSHDWDGTGTRSSARSPGRALAEG
ncbi:hypothetical protein ACFWTE_05005 [Nocardiopsis sp. NPDC058631]|uniref:hypothetical protein n=1 Tax=Nocardiopsis sp. NPDC058631 TaxID=3346566 RepID=UPI00364E1C66